MKRLIVQAIAISLSITKPCKMPRKLRHPRLVVMVICAFDVDNNRTQNPELLLIPSSTIQLIPVGLYEHSSMGR